VTTWLPCGLKFGLSVPISGSMAICVALDTFQFSCHWVELSEVRTPIYVAVNLITGLLAVVCGGGDSGAELTVVTADLVTVPEALVALIVYTVDVAGDTTLVPATSTRPIPWSILTDVAPVTFHNRVDVPPALIVEGLLLKVPITEGDTTAGVVADGKQPGMRISNSNSDSERKTNLFNVVTS
jgi:hypothetical protein